MAFGNADLEIIACATVHIFEGWPEKREREAHLTKLLQTLYLDGKNEGRIEMIERAGLLADPEPAHAS